MPLQMLMSHIRPVLVLLCRWTAWVDLREARLYAFWTLRHAANTLRSPDLSIGFRAWAVHAQHRRKRVEQRERESGLAALRSERDEFEHALSAVRMECDAKLESGIHSEGLQPSTSSHALPALTALLLAPRGRCSDECPDRAPV